MVARRQSTITLWNVVSNSALLVWFTYLLYPNKLKWNLKWNLSIIANHDNTSLGYIKLKILCHWFKVQSCIQSCAVKTLVTNSSVSEQLTEDQPKTSSPNFVFLFHQPSQLQAPKYNYPLQFNLGVCWFGTRTVQTVDVSMLGLLFSSTFLSSWSISSLL